MRKMTRYLLVTLVLTVACATPVFATEKNLSDEINMLHDRSVNVGNAMSTVLQFDNNCGPEAKIALHTLVDIARADLKSSSRTEIENYIKYLKAVVGNAIENERIKKSNIDALTDLVKVNPSFQTQLDEAVAEYNQAVAERVMAEAAIVEAQKAFDEYKISIINEVEARGNADPDRIKK